MSDNEHQDHRQTSKRNAVAVTLGAVAWIACVAFIVARGWGA
ncbi:hypothetical protein OG756_22090 [Streptomyces sp. NBC_01310]|nr:hypothetical protein OG756_22090 [Streptomyces sp. NBC_01310]